jgi:hypothetical protein
MSLPRDIAAKYANRSGRTGKGPLDIEAELGKGQGMQMKTGKIFQWRPRDDRPRVVVMAVLAGLAIYLPQAILIKFSLLGPDRWYWEESELFRGAVVGLFVGLARRSLLWTVVGAFVGIAMSWLYLQVWYSVAMELNIIWDHRHGYNPLLGEWLPGACIGTHTFSPWPRWAQFLIRVTFWHWFVWTAWWICWRPRLSALQFLRTILVSSIVMAVVCGILWRVTPLRDLSGRISVVWGELPNAIWMTVYLLVFPLCSVVCALQFKYADATSRRIGEVFRKIVGKRAVGDE